MRNILAATIVLMALMFFMGFTSGALYSTISVCEKITNSELAAAACVVLSEEGN